MESPASSQSTTNNLPPTSSDPYNPAVPDDVEQILRDRFGLTTFRKGQREVIDDVLAGKDVLCVMPTGAGKSLCYQLPAVAHGGLTIVVSPLISLMSDQVRQLGDRGIDALYLNSGQSAAEQSAALSQVRNGFDGLLYVAPERFFAPNFQPFLKSMNVKLFAIDEAHCVSHWGHDFRPEYGQLGPIRDLLGNPPTIALTATATDDVRADIIRQLHLREPSIYITGFDRPNLSYECIRINKRQEKYQHLLNILRREQGTGIIYCSTRKAVDELTSYLPQALSDRPIFAYHAGMDAAARSSNQANFMSTPRAIVVATTAFGMGVNKPDIRFVIHFNFAGTIEGYYQEAGRAGRDGDPARCIVLFSFADRRTQEFFIEKIGEDGSLDALRKAELQQIARDKLELMVRFLSTHRCRRQMILDYFGDESEIKDCTCDVCSREGSGSREEELVDDETTLVIRKILSAIARLNGKFGTGMVADVLIGNATERIAKFGIDKQSTFGLLAAHSANRVKDMIRRTIEAGLAEQVDPDRNFRPIVRLTNTGVKVMKAEVAPPPMLVDLLPRHCGVEGEALAEPWRDRRKVSSSATIQLDADAEERFQRLRTARTELARERNVPAYVICHDSTLKYIALEAPGTLEELETVKGMGPMKVKLYGERLLASLR